VEFEGDLNDTEGKAEAVLREQSFLLPWNDLDAIDYVLSKYHNDVSAVIMEPICINGGGIMPKPGYLEGVRDLCDRYGVVLIFDEMITGFRVGLGGAQQMLGVVPDLTTLGKAMAGGAVPVSAIAGKRSIMQLYEQRKVTHGGTFNGYAIGMAAVKVTLEILAVDNARSYISMNEQMERIRSIFLSEATASGICLEMKGTSACAVFDVPEQGEDANDKARMIAQYTKKLLSEAMVENGILVSNLNRFYGNISVNDADVSLFGERTREVFRSVRDFLQKIGGRA
jgi:glutamate-1-semialdehyde 2,1-aminomutase